MALAIVLIVGYMSAANSTVKLLTLRARAWNLSLRNVHEGADETIVARSGAELQEASGEKDAYKARHRACAWRLHLAKSAAKKSTLGR